MTGRSSGRSSFLRTCTSEYGTTGIPTSCSSSVISHASGGFWASYLTLLSRPVRPMQADLVRVRAGQPLRLCDIRRGKIEPHVVEGVPSAGERLVRQVVRAYRGSQYRTA